MQNIILNSLDFKDFIKSVRKDPCKNSYTLRINYDNSGTISSPVKSAIDSMGFEIEKIEAGKHPHFDNGSVEIVPCTIVSLKPTEKVNLPQESFSEKLFSYLL